ncbi:MAG: hypothetical protein ACTSUO_05695 [Candidatus Thorarchaeota archaeon]
MARLRKLTNGTVSLVDNGVISIVAHQQERDYSDQSNVLVISSKSKFLRVIPIPEGPVLMIRVAMDLELFTETARTLYSEVKQRDIEILHSTGFCPFDEYCLWESYFSAEDQNKIGEFINWIRGLKPVQELEITYLKKE